MYVGIADSEENSDVLWRNRQAHGTQTNENVKVASSRHHNSKNTNLCN
jgi:hypothetical protein